MWDGGGELGGRGSGGAGLSRRRGSLEVGDPGRRRPHIGCCEDFGFYFE